MNLDERIRETIKASHSVPGLKDYQPSPREIEAQKQLIKEVLEYVKPERLDRRNLSDEELKRAVWYDQAIDEMETKQKDLGL